MRHNLAWGNRSTIGKLWDEKDVATEKKKKKKNWEFRILLRKLELYCIKLDLLERGCRMKTSYIPYVAIF